MKLNFIPERLGIILRLKNKTQSWVAIEMSKALGLTHTFKIDKWFGGLNDPSFDRAEALAKVLGVPVEYFYFEVIEITMSSDLMITIRIPGTTKESKFSLIEDK
jgi:transcriptional regulator with XRE-family HTH domain